MRHFEEYLLDAKNGFVPDKLTTAGAKALISLKRMRDKADKVRDKADKVLQRARQTAINPDSP